MDAGTEHGFPHGLMVATWLETKCPAHAQTVHRVNATAFYFQWDSTGEQLAILPNGNTVVLIWNGVGRDPTKIDTEFKVRGWRIC